MGQCQCEKGRENDHLSHAVPCLIAAGRSWCMRLDARDWVWQVVFAASGWRLRVLGAPKETEKRLGNRRRGHQATTRCSSCKASQSLEGPAIAILPLKNLWPACIMGTFCLLFYRKRPLDRAVQGHLRPNKLPVLLPALASRGMIACCISKGVSPEDHSASSLIISTT